MIGIHEEARTRLKEEMNRNEIMRLRSVIQNMEDRITEVYDAGGITGNLRAYILSGKW